jgi:transposase-like protein
MLSLLAEQERSGLSVAAFARRRGLRGWVLYDWKRRLRSERKGARSEPTPSFAPVRLIAGPATSRSLEVALRSGIKLSIPAGFDEDELRRLVGVLESC